MSAARHLALAVALSALGCGEHFSRLLADGGTSSDGGSLSDAGAPSDAGTDAGTCVVPPSCDVAFSYPFGGETSVTLRGDFDHWGAGVAMQRQGSAWTASLANEANGTSVAYKFLVDGGTWFVDPANPLTQPDGVGGFNSLRTVQCGYCDGGPPRACDARQYGAVGDGRTLDTAAIQSAIADCQGTGGTVYLTQGTYLSGMISLGSDMTFFIDGSATLLGTLDDAGYPDTNPPTDNTQLVNCRKALVYAQGVSQLTIAGTGTINGNGSAPQWNPAPAHSESTRPMPVYIALSDQVTIQDITIKDGAMWDLVNLETDDLTIRNVTIDSLASGTRDGIDVVDCHRVTIDGCTISSEDDSICFKSGVRRGVQDATVSNCHIVTSLVANGLKFGTASYGSFQNVDFHDITIDSVSKAAMAVEAVDGADISNISFERITVGTVGSPFFILLGDRGTTPSNDVHKIGSIDSISFSDITLQTTNQDWGSPVSGSIIDGGTYPLTNLSFTNVKTNVRGGLTTIPADPPEYAGQYPDPNLWGDLPGFGFFIRHASGVHFTNSPITSTAADARPPLAQSDVSGLTIQ